VHEGEVPIYEDTNLERLADRVIDIAGHLQKQGGTDTLWISEEVFNHISDKSGFRPIAKVIDGYKVYEWVAEPGMAADSTLIGELPAPPLPGTGPLPTYGGDGKKRISRYEIKVTPLRFLPSRLKQIPMDVGRQDSFGGD